MGSVLVTLFVATVLTVSFQNCGGVEIKTQLPPSQATLSDTLIFEAASGTEAQLSFPDSVIVVKHSGDSKQTCRLSLTGSKRVEILSAVQKIKMGSQEQPGSETVTLRRGSHLRTQFFVDQAIGGEKFSELMTGLIQESKSAKCDSQVASS